MVNNRSEARRLEYEKPMPLKHEGKIKHYEEVFINPGGEPTEELAKKHLKAIQNMHPENRGWICFNGHEGTFKDTDNLWYAYRHHAQYT